MPSALAIGTASRGYLKMLHLHWLLAHPRLHLPASVTSNRQGTLDAIVLTDFWIICAPVQQDSIEHRGASLGGSTDSGWPLMGALPCTSEIREERRSSRISNPMRLSTKDLPKDCFGLH
jgi:hypothetical protein